MVKQVDKPLKNSAQISVKPKEFSLKLLVVGDPCTGKTTLIRRYVSNYFNSIYQLTVGVDFAVKILQWDPSTILRLQIWDISGEERSRCMTRAYYKNSVGAILVIDVTRYETLLNAKKWKADLDEKVLMPDGSPIPVVLAANKCDEPKHAAFNDPYILDKFCRYNGFVGWYYTSVKVNINIEQIVSLLLSQIVPDILSTAKMNQENETDKDILKLDKVNSSTVQKSWKCPCLIF